mmetsp:Transcript_64488/g.185400  ORF Transcript_64488/g.185400 Transcript_64488/m.185400 type:complete len:203 (+) Transcript_64488:890-1498(+)
MSNPAVALLHLGDCEVRGGRPRVFEASLGARHGSRLREHHMEEQLHGPACRLGVRLPLGHALAREPRRGPLGQERQGQDGPRCGEEEAARGARRRQEEAIPGMCTYVAAAAVRDPVRRRNCRRLRTARRRGLAVAVLSVGVVRAVKAQGRLRRAAGHRAGGAGPGGGEAGQGARADRGRGSTALALRAVRDGPVFEHRRGVD